ncbi:MAG: YjbH domain-containing protein, partial [Solirubrobacteraceae bacterium]|nr:YjbH domain-containing protein [Solirubrobacteraceae bacterium]
MKKLTAPALVLCLLALPISGCGSSSETSSTGDVPEKVSSAMADRDATGQALANGWFGLLAATGSGTGTVTVSPEEVRGGGLLKPYLDPAFQLQRASGERYLASNYVPTDIDRFKVSNVVVTNPREGVKVVRYVVRTPGATTPDSSTVLSSEASPRLTVFRWDEGSGHWMVVSHANFNTPVAAICDHKPVAVTKEKPDTSAEDVKTGEALVNEWRDITLGKTKKAVLDPANQIQLADGQGWPNPNGEKIKWAPAKAYESKDIAITQNEDLLVASYDAVVSDLAVEGSTYGSE